jgi:excisionase family DNA binding protein
VKLLRPAEAARLLGVSRSMVYKLIAEGTVPAVRLSSRVLRVPEDELLEAIGERRVGGPR